MLYFDRIDNSDGIDANKTNASKECNICHHWYFLDQALNFELNVYNGCHDISMISINLNDIVILNICGVYYPCIIKEIDKSEAIYLPKTADLTEKRGLL